MSMMKAIIEPISPNIAAQNIATSTPVISSRQSAATNNPRINTPTPSTLTAANEIDSLRIRDRRCHAPQQQIAAPGPNHGINDPLYHLGNRDKEQRAANGQRQSKNKQAAVT
jgi:hypothetical protein